MKKNPIQLLLSAGLAAGLVIAAAAQTAAPAARPIHRSPLLSGAAAKDGGNVRPAPAASASAATVRPGLPPPAASAAAPKDAKASVPALSFNQAPVELVLQAYAEQVGKTVLPAPDIPKTQITLKSQEGVALTKDEYLEAIEVTLSMNGIVLEPFGTKFLKALSRKTVRTQGIPITMNVGTNALPEKGRVVSQMIPFQYIPAAEGQKALEGFKDPNGLFQVFERTNAILVTDTQENINRMLEMVRVLDVPSAVLEDVFVRQIKFALAADIQKALEAIVTESQKETSKDTVTTKSSGTPGFTRSTASTTPRLLVGAGFNRQTAGAAGATPNETMTADVDDADRGMIRGKVLILPDERSNKLIIITKKSNMDFFDRVIETLDVETAPEVKVEVIRLKYADAEDLSSTLNDLIGGTSSSSSSKSSKSSSSSSSSSRQGNRNLTSSSSSGTSSSSNPYRASTPSSSSSSSSANAKIGELSRDNVKVLPDKRINGLVVMARSQDMPILLSIIDKMDVKLAQVLIETVVLQVNLSGDISTGIDWVNAVSKAGQGISGAIAGGGGTTSKGALETVADAGTAVAAAGALPQAAGINYFMKSSKLNLGAIIQASKSDSRTKYLASPIIMTVDNKEASIEATQMRYLLKGYTYSGSTYNGTTVPDYEQKEIGLTVKVTPKINPNGTVMLTVEEEFSSIGENQTIQTETGGSSGTNSSGSVTGVSVPTTTTRKLSADISVENMQTVVLGGLTQTTTTREDTGIPILKDIPWIGRYLFGKTTDSEQRQELLVFMTPYVLDDAAAAQAEAARRKAAMSDSRPWQDNGWSASQLADPVSQKELLRRQRDVWDKQTADQHNAEELHKAEVKHAKAQAKYDKDVAERAAAEAASQAKAKAKEVEAESAKRNAARLQAEQKQREAMLPILEEEKASKPASGAPDTVSVLPSAATTK